MRIFVSEKDCVVNCFAMEGLLGLCGKVLIAAGLQGWPL